MSYLSVGLATLSGLIASLAFGFLVMWLVPALFEEAHKHPAVFRPKEEMMKVMPIGMVANLVAILVATIIFAMIPHGGSGIADGVRLGVLMGILAVCNVMHNFANLNLGAKLVQGQAAAYFAQWVVVGMVIGLVYTRLAAP